MGAAECCAHGTPSATRRGTRHEALARPGPRSIFLDELGTLSKSILSAALPYWEVFQKPVEHSSVVSGTATWRFPLVGLPACAADSGVNEYPMRFAHFSSPLGMSGILRTGVITPASIQTLAEESGHQGGRFCPLGFFAGYLQRYGAPHQSSSSYPVPNTPKTRSILDLRGWSKANTSSFAGPTR